MSICLIADTILLRCNLGHAHSAACCYLSLLDCYVDLQVFDITREQEKTKQAEAAAQQAQQQAAAQQYAKASAGVRCKPGWCVVHAPTSASSLCPWFRLEVCVHAIQVSTWCSHFLGQVPACSDGLLEQ